MMRSLTIWPVAAYLAALAMPLPAAAQQPAEPPPKLEKLEEGETPAITIRKPDSERKITEKRQQGKVTEIKVQSGKSTYYLKPNAPAGSALPGDAQSNSIRAPQWQVQEFDLARKNGTVAAEAAQTPAPPPAASEAPKK